MKPSRWLHLASGAIAALLAFALCVSDASARELNVYLSPTGADNASGTSPSEALRNLNAGMRFLGHANAGDTLTYHLAPGSYEPRPLVWRVPTGVKLVFSGTAGKTIFDGAGSDRYWGMLELTNPRSEVVVSGLVIRGFRGGIFIKGGGREGGRATITDNQFIDIGQSSPTMEVGFEAVGMKNGYGSLISRNSFVNIRNVDASRCEGMHSIYLANGSNNNTVRDNRFDRGCGDTIKVRNRSNGNIIESNQFLNQTSSWFADTYCDRAGKGGCTNEECPSWDNTFLNNSGDPVPPNRHRVRVLNSPPGPSCTERSSGTRVKVGAEDAEALGRANESPSNRPRSTGR